MNFIQLTGYKTGTRLWVNMDQVRYILPYEDHTFLCETASSKDSPDAQFHLGCKVRETAAQIAVLMPPGSING